MPSQDSYRLYGGRGIKVCDRWHDFSAFRADMGEQPEGTSIDRIDPNGNYEPSNCRWLERDAQMRNKRTNVRLTHNGETMCLTEWARKLGMKPKTLRARIFDHKWDVSKALSEPVTSQKRHSGSLAQR